MGDAPAAVGTAATPAAHGWLRARRRARCACGTRGTSRSVRTACGATRVQHAGPASLTRTATPPTPPHPAPRGWGVGCTGTRQPHHVPARGVASGLARHWGAGTPVARSPAGYGHRWQPRRPPATGQPPCPVPQLGSGSTGCQPVLVRPLGSRPAHGGWPLARPPGPEARAAEAPPPHELACYRAAVRSRQVGHQHPQPPGLGCRASGPGRRAGAGPGCW